MRRFWFVLVVGCGAGPQAPARHVAQPAPPSTAEIDVPDVHPAPARHVSRVIRENRFGAPISIDPAREGSIPTPQARLLDNPFDVAETDYLSRCVREFVQTRPEGARRPLIAAFTDYATSCDAEGRIVLGHPLGYDRNDCRAHSDALFTGTLSSKRVDLVLRVSSCDSGDTASPDHISIVGDDDTWTSQRLEFQRDGNGCDVAELPYTHALGRALLHATTATDATIRFDGDNELAITDSMKHELRMVLDVLDALAP